MLRGAAEHPGMLRKTTATEGDAVERYTNAMHGKVTVLAADRKRS